MFPPCQRVLRLRLGAAGRCGSCWCTLRPPRATHWRIFPPRQNIPSTSAGSELGIGRRQVRVDTLGNIPSTSAGSERGIGRGGQVRVLLVRDPAATPRDNLVRLLKGEHSNLPNNFAHALRTVYDEQRLAHASKGILEVETLNPKTLSPKP